MADPKALVQLIADLLEGSPKVSKINDSDLPPDASRALNSWVHDNNLPLDDPGTSGALYSIKDAGIADAYFADYAGDDPDQFRAMVVIQNRQIIGESVDVAS